MAWLEWHVDWATEEGAKEHHKQMPGYAEACAKARRESAKAASTGSAEIMVYENAGPGAGYALTSVGCVTYWNGRRDTVEGRVKS